MESKVLSKEAVDTVAGGESSRLCFQCGLCTASCPWNNVRTFMPHKIITQSKFGLIKRGVEDWWFCTTCNMCLSRCPRGVSTTEIMLALRRILVEEGRVPITLRDALEAVFKQGNPWGRARSKRSEWAEGLAIKDVTRGEKADMLLYVGCAPSYDPRVQKISRALVNIFSKAGIDVGFLGNEETCCGNEVRRMGENGLFEMLAERNLELFHQYHIDRIVTISPHCYNAFKNEYQDMKIEVKHYTEFLAELVDTGKLNFSRDFEKVVTYHDPCYLGRHNGLYDEPRRILKGIPGLKLVEMLDCRENSLCCGGGGGRMWVETEKEERFSDLRINQALQTGAKVLATSCPFCVLNLEDSLLTMDKSDELEVKDISEIFQEVTEK